MLLIYIGTALSGIGLVGMAYAVFAEKDSEFGLSCSAIAICGLIFLISGLH